jgi:hypothetical protein
VRKVTTKLRPGGARLEAAEKAQTPGPARQVQSAKARPKRATTDIPMDDLAAAYTPRQASAKAGFRDDGRLRQSGQEFGRRIPDDRFAEEDGFTNKSGDPRIGTHRRTYEPGERSKDEVR